MFPFVDYPVICGECGEMLYRRWKRGEEPSYRHSAPGDDHRDPKKFSCPNDGKTFKVHNRIVELEEIHHEP